MAMITLILMMSVLMWYIIDRFKPLWAGAKYSKYITTAVAALFAALFAAVLCFGLRLDLLAAFAVNAARPWRLGIVLTALVLMSGSSAATEVIAKFKNTKLNDKAPAP